MPTLRLSHKQSDILSHRLEVDDALADVFADSGYQWTAEEVYEACRRLLSLLPVVPALEELSPCEIDCLEDAVNGSTYLGTHIGNSTELQIANVYSSGCSLAKKLGAHIGRVLEYPEC